MVKLAAALMLAMTPTAPAVVDAPAGVIEGLPEGGVMTYRGIPYARPPVGELRWRAPQKLDRWITKLSAQKFGSVCMQAEPKGDMGVGLEAPSEDCLTLNIWSADNAEQPKPVMVWLHGGGYVSGSGSAPLYDAWELAQRGVVVVTLNYRLGRFGFFAHPDLATEKEGANFGLLDQRAALEWVRDNIAAFGGDPHNVTLFGNSAGGESVLFHMVSPGSRALFHKAIVQSGLGGRTLVSADRSVEKEYAIQSIDHLRKVPASDIITQGSPSIYRGFGPAIDGFVVHEAIETAFRSGRQARVPLIIGYNSFEFPPAALGGKTATLGLVGHTMKERARGIRAYGSVDSYEERIASDALFRMPALRLALLHAKRRNPTFIYEFDVVSPAIASRLVGAPHASERAYVFNNLKYLGWPTDARDHAVAREMGDRWVAFANRGEPDIASSGWRRLKPDDQPYIFTNDTGRKRSVLSPALSRYFNVK